MLKQSPILAADRHRQIVNIVDREGSIRATDLARLFSVTQETIRLDLERLEAEGLLVRKHGGAVTLRSLPQEVPFDERRVALVREKSAIAKLALESIAEGDTILLDASSTAWQLARILPDMPLTVVTSAIKIIALLANHRSVRVIATGGTLSAPSLSLVGPMAERSLREYHVDKLFLSCAGVDMKKGLSESHEWQATLKTAMIEQSTTRILMVDRTKFNVRSLSVFGKLRDFHRVITDDGIAPEILRELRAAKVPVEPASTR